MATRHSIIEPFPDHIDREAFGHWLSGFCDGEATFGLREQPCRGRNRIACHAYFRITLRNDDAEILQKIRSFWRAGNLHYSDNRRSKISNAKPIAIFNAGKTSDLVTLIIPHFERYPLYAKKRNDFLVWRQGVELIASVKQRPNQFRRGRGFGRNWHQGSFPKWSESERDQFRTLVQELRGQRQYENTTVPVRPSIQHRLDDQGMLF